jgi:oligosaccharide repeat unit polymerase
MNINIFLFFCNVLIMAYASYIDYKKTGMLITPISYFSLTNTLSLLYPVFFLYRYPHDLSVDYNNDYLFLHTLYIFIFCLVYRFSPRFNFYSPGFVSLVDNKRPAWAFVFLALFFISFYLLAVKSGAGSLWIFDSREAYQRHRDGVGFIYAVTVFLLGLAFVFTLSSVKRIYFCFVFFTILSFFLGSKGVTITMIMVFYYYSIVILKIKIPMIFSILVFIILSVLIVQLSLLLGVGMEFTVAKYFEYIINSALFYQEFTLNGDEFIYGKGFASELYRYVPRVFYDQKPYAYGSVLITEYLWPGLASAGHTPGKVDYLIYYYDFGFIGVFIYCISSAFLMKMMFYYSLTQKNILGLAIYMSTIGLPLFKYGSLFVNVVLILLIGVLVLLFNKIVSR